jgi:uncharacterized membrane protein (UPF0127 family)
LLLVLACSTTGQSDSVSTTGPASSDPTAATTTTAVPTTAPTTTTTVPATALTTTTTTAVPTTTVTEVDVGDLVEWDILSISVGDRELMVAIADDPGERTQGLMGVDELGDLDGMLFVFPQEALSGFWMKGTLIPLDIAFFGDDKSLVDVLNMVPCTTEQCPSYVPDGPFSWAVETPAGTLGPLPEGTVLSIDG